MARSRVVFLLLISLATTSCGGASSSGEGKLYNDLLWANGSSISATLTISDISMSAKSHSWSSVSSSNWCGGNYTAVLRLDGQDYGSTTLPFECNIMNNYTVTYSDKVVVYWENGGANRTAIKFTRPH